jgi:FixJ family two-component response regulator
MSTKPRVIAVIDDHPCILNSMRQLLSTYGYRTELYASARAFLNAAGSTEANCLLVDIQLGEGCGLDLARRLLEAGLSFPVIFMTANYSDWVKRRALEAGGLAILTKPFTPELLIELLSNLPGSRTN